VGAVMVGLTGGIGAGKTAVARRLAALGAVVIDADQLARDVVAPGTEGLADVVAAFGAGVLAPDGSLDRAALGRVVFGDDTARRRLEAIVHPRVRARTAEIAAAAPPGTVVVDDVPLLVEAGLASGYQVVIVVEADPHVRVARLAGRGMTESEASARMRAQASDAERRAVADAVIVNDGTLDELNAAVDEVWRTRIAPLATAPPLAKARLATEPPPGDAG
jgi:dephospho-CoA kinase